MSLSLRTKGLLALAVLILYLALIGVFLAHLRQNLTVIVRQIEMAQATQTLLAPVVNSLARSIVATQSVLNTPAADEHVLASVDLASHVEPISVALTNAQHVFPALGREVGAFRAAASSMREAPSTYHLEQVRDSEQELMVRLHELLNESQTRGAELVQQYHDTQENISNFAVGANIVGAVASVAVILSFFGRLASDIKRLQDRAVAIVGGYDGEPLATTRRDEVGALIEAVNRMQTDMRQWQRQLELTRQQRFHQEKMAAVGSVAAAISHEVCNPIAAISGMAQWLVDESGEGDSKVPRQARNFAAQILRQTERITVIMRQMATLTAPRSPEPELLDLNTVIRSTCGFIAYDRRFQQVELVQELCPDLPAVTAVSDHITQILMNLLINAADAMDQTSEPSRRRILVTSRVADDEVTVEVVDNGRGMTPEVLAKAFDESFSTKPLGKGRGIGLFVCKSLIESGGGRMSLASTPGEGTRASVHLPLRAREAVEKG